MRVESYFSGIRKRIEESPIVRLSTVSYEKRGTHERIIQGREEIGMRKEKRFGRRKGYDEAAPFDSKIMQEADRWQKTVNFRLAEEDCH